MESQEDIKKLKQKREQFRVDIRNSQTKNILSARRLVQFEAFQKNQEQNEDQNNQLTQQLLTLLKSPQISNLENYADQILEIINKLQFTEILSNQFCEKQLHVIVIGLFEQKLPSQNIKLFETLIKLLNKQFMFSGTQVSKAIMETCDNQFFKEVLCTINQELPQNLVQILIHFISNIAGDENQTINDFILNHSVLQELEKMSKNHILSKDNLKLCFLLFRNLTSNRQKFDFQGYKSIFEITSQNCQSEIIQNFEKEYMEDLLIFVRMLTYQMNEQQTEDFYSEYPLILASIISEIMTDYKGDDQTQKKFYKNKFDYYELVNICSDIVANILCSEDTFVEELVQSFGVLDLVEFLLNQGQKNLNIKGLQILENLFQCESQDLYETVIAHKINEYNKLVKLFDNYINSGDREYVKSALSVIANFVNNCDNVDFILDNKVVFLNNIVKYLDKNGFLDDQEILFNAIYTLTGLAQKQKDGIIIFKNLILNLVQIETINQIYQEDYNIDVCKEAEDLLEYLQGEEQDDIENEDME